MPRSGVSSPRGSRKIAVAGSALRWIHTRHTNEPTGSAPPDSRTAEHCHEGKRQAQALDSSAHNGRRIESWTVGLGGSEMAMLGSPTRSWRHETTRMSRDGCPDGRARALSYDLSVD